MNRTVRPILGIEHMTEDVWRPNVRRPTRTMLTSVWTPPIQLDPNQPDGIPISFCFFMSQWNKHVRRAYLSKLKDYVTVKQMKHIRSSIASYMLNRHPSKAGQKNRLVRTPGMARTPRHA
jgi:hypothetical protein